VKQLESASAEKGKQLLSTLVTVDVQKALAAAGPMAAGGDVDAQQQVLAMLAHVPPATPAATRLLEQLLGSADEDVRIDALELAATRKEAKLFDAIVKHTEGAAKHLSEREADAIGEAMVRVAPSLAAQKFHAWAHPKKGLIGGLSHQAQALGMAAAAGLGVTPGPEPEKLIRELMNVGDEKLKAHCVEVMKRRRRMTAGAKPHG